MNLYLDESYNLQKERGKTFISINGFAVLNDTLLRKRWKTIRKPYAGSKRRIHATDSSFRVLWEKSIKLLGRHDVNILFVFQLTQELPYNYYDDNGIKFETVYSTLLKKLLIAMSLEEYKTVRIIIDARKHKGGRLREKMFQKELTDFLALQFADTICVFKPTPSYIDVLVELADFVSNTFYREYQSESRTAFQKLGFKLIQIKNPL